MERHLRRFRRVVAGDRFAVVESAALLGAVLGTALAVVVAGDGAVRSLAARAFGWAAVAGLVVLVVTLLVHAAHDCWRLATADAGERLPSSGPDVARALWRVLETLVAAAYVVVVPFSLWILTELPDTEQGAGFAFGFAGLAAFATLVLVTVVAVRVVGTVLYRWTVGGDTDVEAGRRRR